MKIKKKVLSVILTLALCVTAIPVGITATDYADATTYQKLKITWFDVGAGDSMYMRLPNGKNVLIDGGLSSKGASIVKKLKNQNVSTIHYLLSTHPDADHVGGLQTVFEEMEVKNFYYPDDAEYDSATAERVMELAYDEGCNLINPERGKKIKGGNGCVLKFVQSDANYSADNEDSLAMFIDYGPLEVLVCGDNEKGSQEVIEKHNVDVLQLPHHGSKYATSAAFIKRFDPEFVVVSTDGKRYGHPNKEVFQRLKAYDKNIKVFRTDKKGDITITATAKSWKFNKKGTLVSKYCTSSGSTSGTTGGSVSSGTTSGSTKTYVFTTQTGSKYHKSKSCRGLSNAKAVYKKKLSTAKGNGLEPCKICC